MRIPSLRLLSVVGLILGGVPAAQAQSSGPVAVPIVGSPAAQRPPSQLPAMPPKMPPQMPAQPPFIPTIVPSPATAAPASAVASASGALGQRKLDLSLKNGTVALDAQNVTVREILAEWQRRSGCQFVNSDKITGGLVTLQFPAGTPELNAIDSLLRGLGSATNGYGYIVAPPVNSPQTGSVCGAVYILPTSHPTASAFAGAPGSSPIAIPLMSGGSPDDEIPPVRPPLPVQPVRPVNSPVAGPQPGTQGSTPSAAPSGGFGAVAPSATGIGQFGGAPTPTPPNAPGRN